MQRGILEVDGDKYTIESCNYGITRSVGSYGKPTGDIFAGSISLHFDADQDEDGKFLEWMVSPYTKKKGKIEIPGDEEGKILRTIEFEDAYLTSYDEAYNHNHETMTSISLAARKLKIGNAEHTNSWKKV